MPLVVSHKWGGHDVMHRRMIDGVTHWCYCYCAKCWRPEGIVRHGDKERVGNGKGTCICENCPCRAERRAGAVATERHAVAHAGPPVPAQKSSQRGRKTGSA